MRLNKRGENIESHGSSLVLGFGRGKGVVRAGFGGRGQFMKAVLRGGEGQKRGVFGDNGLFAGVWGWLADSFFIKYSQRTAFFGEKTSAVRQRTASAGERTRAVCLRRTPVGEGTTEYSLRLARFGAGTAQYSLRTAALGESTTALGESAARFGGEKRW